MIASSLCVNQWFEGDVTLFVITCGVDDISLVITQLEAELTFFEGSFAKNLVKGKYRFSRCCLFNRVIEDGIFRHGSVCDVGMSFFIDGNKDGCFHGVIDNVFVVSFDFFNGVLVSACLFVGDWIKDDVSIFIIGFGIDEGTICSFQLEGEFTVFEVTAS